MSDIPLFLLDHAGRWRLAHDSQQWIIQLRSGSPRLSDSGAMRKSGWKAVSFIADDKRVLHRCLREAGVGLTPEATARLDALPDSFLEFDSAHPFTAFVGTRTQEAA